MNIIEETLSEFGRSMGMSELRLRDNASAVLSVQSIGTLAFDVAGRTQDSVIISLAKPLPQGKPVDERRLLSLLHYRSRPRLPMQGGTLKGHLILAVVVRQEEFTLLRINEVIQLLDQQHQSMEGSR